MVAAWIRAETGVGPSIASGSQVCSGIWADLAAAPTNSATQTVSKAVVPNDPAWAKTSPNAVEPVAANITKIANMMPTSPTTLRTKALRAAATADGFSIQ